MHVRHIVIIHRVSSCVLSPPLYNVYTDDCRSWHDNRLLFKFADDSVTVSFLHADENNHGPIVDCESVVVWLCIFTTKCDKNQGHEF